MFRFTIREVVLVTIIVALMFGWLWAQAEISSLNVQCDCYRDAMESREALLDRHYPQWDDPRPGEGSFQSTVEITFAEWLRSHLPF